MAILQGLMIGFLTLGAYFIGSRLFPMEGGAVNIPLGESMAFATLAISQLVHAFNIRSKFSMFKAGFLTNKYMVGAFFASLALMLIVLLVPFMQGIFEVIAMSMGQWLIILGLSLAPFIIMEVVKLFTGREGN